MSDILHGHPDKPLGAEVRAPVGRGLCEIQEEHRQRMANRYPSPAGTGSIYDGVHRLKACIELGLEPRFTEIGADEDLKSFVIAHNADRRDNTDKDDKHADCVPVLRGLNSRQAQGH